ncbi:MAG TPA: hypothetical protein VHK27_06970 [Gammaproteobacteria bacterium]|jgi:hypothetical protein|nr:hypothetical protein [Gammaproteobacteria bacterium]HEX2275683.1 hypothetical protein [Candidatus Tectomicrobia bacterium]
MDRMIGDAKLQANDRGDPATGPHLAAEAIGFGPMMQHFGQAGQLRGRQAPRGARGWVMPERLWSTRAGTLHPLTDRGFADIHCFGDGALGPALLLELPSSETSGFFPVVG